ncbi:hypothetical protein [uncultured Paraglaciecola sp.]|uniref:hypothetical protein n=1 Tax=uncultured Paraglaciecola sp. TaxID=1765024 RepID=UPI00262A1EC8|nr:hypothetical protein [uncultured Paraglaciecola sp.]
MKNVKAIIVEIDGKEQRLTVKEAKALHAALGELVGEKPVKVEHHHHNPPIWTHRPYMQVYNATPLKPGEITCNANAQMATANLSERMSVSGIGKLV